MDPEGTYDDLYAAVPMTLAGYLDDGDVGGSVAVVVDGEPVVDMWGGYADAARTLPWERDTVACVFSVTKTMTALTVLLLADRRELDLDAAVAAYWPEFAAAGKEGVLVRHVLAHTRETLVTRPLEHSVEGDHAADAVLRLHQLEPVVHLVQRDPV